MGVILAASVSSVQCHDRDVFVSGIGAWTPYGVGWPEVWEALVEGRHAFAPVGEGFGPDPQLYAGRIADWSVFNREFPSARPPLPIPSTRLALVAAAQALAAAGLDDDDERSRFGVMFNRNRGPAQVVVKIMETVFANGPRKTSPLLFSQSVSNAPLGAVATRFGLRGPHLLTMGGGAILTAFDAIRRGDAPGVLIGGFEEHVSQLFAADLENAMIQAVHSDDTIAARGPVMSEGAVCVVLESRASVERRGVTPLAELRAVERGVARAASDGDSLALWGEPDPHGFAKLAGRALQQAGVDPSEVDFHAGSRSGVPAYERAEQGLHRSLGFGRLVENGRVGSIKPLLGELMGAAAPANLAWASTMIAKRQIARSTTGSGRGMIPLEARVKILTTHLDVHASQFAAVLTEAH